MSLNYVYHEETKVKPSFGRITFITPHCDHSILLFLCLTVGTMGTEPVSVLTYCHPQLAAQGQRERSLGVLLLMDAAVMAECGHLRVSRKAQAPPPFLLPQCSKVP